MTGGQAVDRWLADGQWPAMADCVECVCLTIKRVVIVRVGIWDSDVGSS